MIEAASDPREILTERDVVICNRFIEARDAGLTDVDATTFAEGDIDIGQLRKLVKSGCPPVLIARIIT